MDSLPPWPVVQALLLSVVLPGFAVGAGLLAVVCTATRSENARLIGAALALGCGLAAGNYFHELLPWWSLEFGWPSLFPATLAAVGGGIIAALVSSRSKWYLGLALRLIVVAGCAWWLTPVSAPPSISRHWLFFLLFVGSALNWEAFRLHGGRCLGRGTLLTLAIPWGAAAAAVLIHAHSARFCDLAVLMSATLAGIGLIAAIRKLELAPIFAGPAVFFPALMLNGAESTYSDVPVASFILVALAPCALWVASLPPMRSQSGRALAVTATIAILIPCAVAIALAMRAEALGFGE
jgi:hypothetical protein